MDSWDDPARCFVDFGLVCRFESRLLELDRKMGNGWKCCESSGWTGNHHVTGEYYLVSSNVAGKSPKFFIVDFPVFQAPFIVDFQLPCLIDRG